MMCGIILIVVTIFYCISFLILHHKLGYFQKENARLHRENDSLQLSLEKEIHASWECGKHDAR